MSLHTRYRRRVAVALWFRTVFFGPYAILPSWSARLQGSGTSGVQALGPELAAERFDEPIVRGLFRTGEVELERELHIRPLKDRIDATHSRLDAKQGSIAISYRCDENMPSRGGFIGRHNQYGPSPLALAHEFETGR